MGYFANGSEGISYMEQWCSHCSNCGDDKYEFGCSVWDLHTLFQGDRDSSPDGGPVGRTLDALIPRTEDGLGNERCTMFREVSDGACMTFLERFDAMHGMPYA
jgi:hypothetical protein